MAKWCLEVGEEQYYEVVRKWLERQGYYCGGSIAVRGKPNFYQNIGTKHRRADVAGVKNVGNRYEDDIEVVAIEVRDRALVSERDINDTDRYRYCAHKCYLATTASITEQYRLIAERRNIGLLQLEKGKQEPRLLHEPTPRKPEDYAEMMAFLDSFEIVKCSICGCFFERFHRTEESYYSYFEMTRPAYFKVSKETQKLDPLDLKEVEKLSSEYKINRYICYPCLEELFLKPRKIERRKRMLEFHACWTKDGKGFLCLVGEEKTCTEYIYNPIEIVEHLRDKHNIDPYKQEIKGWTEKHERAWEKHISKKG